MGIFSSLYSIFAHKNYCRYAVRKYDKTFRVLNKEGQNELTLQIFHEFGIHTLHDLNSYLSKKSEYGGCVTVDWTDKKILIPFHHDFMNKWLRFDNPRVIEFYDKLYRSQKNRFKNRDDFNRRRFDIEEELQMNNWVLAPYDRRMLAAPICGCWDKPELIGKFLSLQGYETRRFCCHDGNIMRGHCFIVYFDGKCWSTSGSYGFDLKCKDYKKFCRIIFSVLRHIPIFNDPSKCEMIEYPPPVPGMDTQAFLENIRNGRVVAKMK